jgi:hypothetical protein
MMTRHFVRFSIIVLAASAVLAQKDPVQRTPQIGFFIAVGYGNLQSPDEAYIFGGTNLPSDSHLMVLCFDLAGQIVTKDTTVTVERNGLFRAHVVPKGSYELKRNMLCSVNFHAWGQPAAVLQITGRNGEKLGSPSINSQVGTYSGGQYLEAATVLR